MTTQKKFAMHGWRSLALALALAGCSSQPARVVQDRPDANAGRIALEMFDADRDGLLSGEELDKTPGLKAALERVDSNHDGAVSAAEIKQRIDRWANSKVGRMSVSCVVNRGQEPISDVEVRLVPEPFLKGTIQAATAVTDRYGGAQPSSPETAEKPPGVGPGFYRVEITGRDPPVDAKFNSATMLGVEIAADVAELMSGPMKFDIGGK